MSIEQKLDEIIKHFAKEKKESEEDPDEKKLKELEKDITEIIELMEANDSRESIEAEIQLLEKKIKEDALEKTPYLRIFHQSNGKKINMHRRNAHLLSLDSAIQKHQKIKKYPADLNHILHVKMNEKIKLVKKVQAKSEKEDK